MTTINLVTTRGQYFRRQDDAVRTTQIISSASSSMSEKNDFPLPRRTNQYSFWGRWAAVAMATVGLLLNWTTADLGVMVSVGGQDWYSKWHSWEFPQDVSGPVPVAERLSPVNRRRIQTFMYSVS